MVVERARTVQRVAIFRGEDEPRLLERIQNLRLDVWGQLMGGAAAARRFGQGAHDDKAWHVVYMEDGMLIAAGRLLLADTPDQVPDACSFAPYLEQMQFPCGILNRLVVSPRYQGRRLAREITLERIRCARECGAREVWVEVQAQRVSAMQRYGFVEVGRSLDETVAGDWRILRRCFRRP
jgi:predicted GNAT family N-acyltransferase